MNVNATRLVDLVELGRAAATRNRQQTSQDVSFSGTPATSAAQQVESRPLAARGLAQLAETLLSISHERAGNPQALMKDALKSIEGYLTAISERA